MNKSHRAGENDLGSGPTEILYLCLGARIFQSRGIVGRFPNTSHPQSKCNFFGSQLDPGGWLFDVQIWQLLCRWLRRNPYGNQAYSINLPHPLQLGSAGDESSSCPFTSLLGLVLTRVWLSYEKQGPSGCQHTNTIILIGLDGLNWTKGGLNAWGGHCKSCMTNIIDDKGSFCRNKEELLKRKAEVHHVWYVSSGWSNSIP